MKRVALWLLALLMGSAFADTAPRAPVWKNLTPFESAREFDRYRHRVREAAEQHGLWWGAMPLSWRDHPLLAQAQPPPCNPAIEDCPDEEQIEAVVVTGYRASLNASVQSSPAAVVSTTSAESITNNQVSNVDEGDIVKAFDRFFIVLHEGRLYSVDTGAGSGTLRVADRVDAYQSKETDSWIDEILIQDDVLLVTGYSYEVQAATIALFRIDREGAFHFLARYFIESNDYFSGENYASRIVDGKLVIYTPVYLPAIPVDRAMPVPRIRSWTPEGGYTPFQPLFGVTDLYHPVQSTYEPALHVVSVCPIRERSFRCRSRGIVGPPDRELFVAAGDAYLWLSDEARDDESGDESGDGDECDAGPPPHGGRDFGSAVFRVPLDGGEITGVRTAGRPRDQFAFVQRGAHLWALVTTSRIDCNGAVIELDERRLELARIPLRTFGVRPYRLADSAWFAVPQIGDGELQARYSADYLLYGENRGLWPMLYDEKFMARYDLGGPYGASKLAVVPLDAPRNARTLPLTHSVERVELFGAHALAFGYGGREGMTVSGIALDGTPRVAASVLLPGVAEAEDRSHAFNATARPDGSGLFGIPTLDLADLRAGRWWDMPSDVSYVAADPALGLTYADKLAAGRNVATRAGYVCEVSCFDWYGNTRPIFYRGRIFALTGREMVEGAPTGGRVVEIARVNLTN